MPQLDKLAFMGQIFWLFMFFILFYYTFVRLTIVRIKLDLGFKHFFFQNTSFYELLKKYNKDLLFFFFENFEKKENSIVGRAETMFNTLNMEDKYTIILEIDNNYFEYLYTNNTKLEIDTNVSKQINIFYDNFFELFSVFFVLKRYYVYETLIHLYSSFFQIFLEERDILLLSVAPKFNEVITE